MVDWAGKTILITGASDGIGRGLVEQFDSRGARQLILIGRDRTRLDQVAAACQTETRIEEVDLADSDQLAHLMQRLAVVEIDVLINNAGVGLGGAFASHEQDDRLQSMIKLNCDAVILLTRAVLPGMLERRRGSLLFVGSLAGWAGGPGLCAYSATKGFVNRFAEGLRWELHGTGVAVSLLAPGATRTSFFETAGIDATDIRGGSMSSSEVARLAILGLQKNRAIIVPGFQNRILWMMQNLLPRSWVGWVSRKIGQPILDRESA
ncbi:MAG: SDR family oxidoreductase [Planctomycetota bacterium]|nr:SDR family oxidoreductase [Planctomycetota bacterium]